MADDLGDFEEVAGVTGVQKGDVAVGWDPPGAGVLEQSGQAVHIALRELEQGEAHALLLRDEIDLAITFDYEHAPAPVPAGLVQEHLMDDPIMVVHPEDHPLALNLVAAGLGVALLPRLLLLDPPPSVAVLPMRRPAVVRRLYTCRLDTKRVTAPTGELETYLREAVDKL